MSNWQEWNVGELEKKKLILVQDGNHGEYRPRKKEFTDKGVAFIRAADLGEGVVKFSEAGKINKIAFDRIRKGIGKDLDTILSTKGTVGKLAYVPKGSPEYVCSPQTTFWRTLDHNFIDPKFLYYELQSRHFINQISSRKGETDMADYLSLTSQRGLSLRVPEIKVQREVVRILSSLDNKIKLNRQINHTLELLASAIFKSWFIDFDPVKVKMTVLEAGGSAVEAETAAMSIIANKSPEDLARLKLLKPENYEQLARTASLFPAAMQECEYGSIPEGWFKKPIKDIVLRSSVGKKYAQKTASPNGNIPILDQGKSGIIGFHNSEPGVKASPANPIIVFANHTCNMRLIMHDFSAIQNVLPFKGKGINIFWLYFATLGRQKFIEYKGHWPDFEIKEVVVPTKGLDEHFGEKISKISEMIYENERQNKKLNEIVASILPKLLSGQVDLSLLNEETSEVNA